MESAVAVTITICFMTVLHLLYYIIQNMYFVTFFFLTKLGMFYSLFSFWIEILIKLLI